MTDTLLIPGLENEKVEPDFTRLRDAVLRIGRSDRLPFLELFADTEIVEAVLDRPWTTDEDKVEFYYRLGYDSVPVSIGLGFAAERKTVPNTALLAQRDRSWVADDVCPIQGREDFECYEWPNPDSVPVEEYIDSTAKVLPDGMKILLQSSGFLENVMWLMGYTAFAEALYDDPQLVSDMFEAVGSRIIRVFERVIDCPDVGGVFFGEDMGFKTATMVGPDHLRKYHFPYLKRLVDLAHEHGKFFILHSCGNLSEVMDDLIDYVGIDAKHSFEDAIMPVAEFKRIYGDRIGVVGGVDVDALARMDTFEFRKYVRRIIEECAPGGGYVLGSGNSVANYVKVENYLAMLEEGWRYRAG
ncbi:MAG: uroporphyrinogen-III decarboxylase-like protein [Armatimonadetes bacterium]|nr:uroporphyrinogen-III decarboxylase-like protein [Armatimonadota bacterium]